jgi:hypothetical protein
VYPEVNLFIGISYYALNQFSDAIVALNHELAANPKDRESRYYLALALDALDRKLRLSSNWKHCLLTILATRTHLSASAFVQGRRT